MTLTELFDIAPSEVDQANQQVLEAAKSVWAERRKALIKELKRSQKGPKELTRIVVKKD